MKIRDIRAVGLRGQTPEGGWSDEIEQEDCIHTLLAVITDEGVIGVGSVYTNDQLVQGALSVLRPLTVGENALEPERVAEKLHQATFWMGRGGSITHTISGIDIALWDVLGKATGQPVGRLLGGRYRDRVMPYASLLMDQAGHWRSTFLRSRPKGFARSRWAGDRSARQPRAQRGHRACRPWAIGPDYAMVDAGRAMPSGPTATSGRRARQRCWRTMM